MKEVRVKEENDLIVRIQKEIAAESREVGVKLTEEKGRGAKANKIEVERCQASIATFARVLTIIRDEVNRV